MRYNVYKILNESDISFLNETHINFTINFFEQLSGNDYGWCDMTTGARILTETDSVIFDTDCDRDKLALELRYGSRLLPLTSDNHVTHTND
jgi:hypothetical protein